MATTTYNHYFKIFEKLRDIFQKDERTSFLSFYGGEYSKKKNLPCVLIFPQTKTYIVEKNERDYRKYGGPRQVHYTFSLWAYSNLMNVEDAYYSNSNDIKAGITQVMTEIEAVLKENHTGTDLSDNTINLWTDMKYETIEYAQKPGKLMIAKLDVTFVSKELK